MLLDLLHGGTRAAFRYLAPDSFYYNTVAQHRPAPKRQLRRPQADQWLPPAVADQAADGTLLKLALERGFDRAASLVYFPADEAQAGVSAVSLPAMALALARQQLGRPQAQLEFVAPSGRFSVITIGR